MSVTNTWRKGVQRTAGHFCALVQQDDNSFLQVMEVQSQYRERLAFQLGQKQAEKPSALCRTVGKRTARTGLPDGLCTHGSRRA